MIWNNLINKIVKKKRSLFFSLIDPDSISFSDIDKIIKRINSLSPDAVLIGGSTLFSDNLNDFVVKFKKNISLPIIIFPGNSKYIVPEADIVLFLTLLSGRNPRWLIEEQLEISVLVNKYNLESIPVSYLLIESGRRTTVEFITNTIPIPSNKANILIPHILASNYMGMNNIYLEAGSGAENPVSEHYISLASQYSNGIVIVGGGLRTPEKVEKARISGADIIVVGTAIENNSALINEMVMAAKNI